MFVIIISLFVFFSKLAI